MKHRLWWLVVVLAVTLVPSIGRVQPPPADDGARVRAPGAPVERLQVREGMRPGEYREGEVVVRFANHPEEKTM
ncbi:MAG: hypothetical protein L5657_05095, partial [Calditerricola sp.]|nr:hypothetical protein [Calditerricola sp.]